MKQLLLATATLVGLSSAALAAEPVGLTDSQLDNVTAGQAYFNSTTFPAATNSAFALSLLGLVSFVGPVGTAANPLTQAQSVPIAVNPTP